MSRENDDGDSGWVEDGESNDDIIKQCHDYFIRYNE